MFFLPITSCLKLCFSITCTSINLILGNNNIFYNIQNRELYCIKPAYVKLSCRAASFLCLTYSYKNLAAPGRGSYPNKKQNITFKMAKVEKKLPIFFIFLCATYLNSFLNNRLIWGEGYELLLLCYFL
jgi:hypothetical protein